MNYRNSSLDILRICACFLLICIHAPLPSNLGDSMFLTSLSYLSAPGLGLFFMISGALLLPINGGIKDFLLRRFTKVLIPVILWSLIYVCIDYFLLKKDVNWIHVLLSLPFSAQGTPVFWFIYTLLGIYLLSPILNRWLNFASLKELEFYLILWVVTLCYPFLKFVANVNISNTGILYYFSGYVGYFILGYYLKIYPNRITWKLLIPALVVVIVVPVVCRLQRLEVDFYDMFWLLSIFVVVQSICWWRIICSIKLSTLSEKTAYIITELSKMTFGIYLIHIFIMRYVLWHCDFILNVGNYYFQTVTIIILTFILSALCTYMIGWLPKSQYLIGYKFQTLNPKQ